MAFLVQCIFAWRVHVLIRSRLLTITISVMSTIGLRRLNDSLYAHRVLTFPSSGKHWDYHRITLCRAVHSLKSLGANCTRLDDSKRDSRWPYHRFTGVVLGDILNLNLDVRNHILI